MSPTFRGWVAAAVVALGMAAPAAAAAAQEPPPAVQERRPGMPRRPMGPEGRDRAELEQRFRETLGRVVQRELGLTDAQSERLARVNQQFDGRRRTLLQRERAARVALRAQLQQDERADGRRVDALLDELLRLQRQRLELQEAEQRELSRFLTPVQRARYLSIQEGVRRRVEAHRGRTRTGARPPGGAGSGGA